MWTVAQCGALSDQPGVDRSAAVRGICLVPADLATTCTEPELSSGTVAEARMSRAAGGDAVHSRLSQTVVGRVRVQRCRPCTAERAAGRHADRASPLHRISCDA